MPASRRAGTKGGAVEASARDESAARSIALTKGRTALEDARAEAERSRETSPSGPTRKATRSGTEAKAPHPEGADRLSELPSTASASRREAEEGVGYGAQDGPESQGRFAGEAFGDAGQGTYGDEDYDPSYGPTGLAGPEPVDPAERGADTPAQEGWGTISAEAEDLVANEERDVATGDAALERVPKRVRRSRKPIRPDDRIREDIEDSIAEVVDPVDVVVEVVDGEVSLGGVVDTAEERDAVEERAQAVEGVRGLENRLELRRDPEPEV